jgi:hypothetical protein
MSTPTPPPIDPVSVATGLAAAALGADMASLIGPYAVIIAASAIGASWSLAGRPPAPTGAAVLFFVRVILLACMLSVGIEQAVHRWVWPITEHWLLAPIAISVGAIGDRWPLVGGWLLERMARIVDRRIGGAP